MNYEKNVYSSKIDYENVVNLMKSVFLDSSKKDMSKIKKRED